MLCAAALFHRRLILIVKRRAPLVLASLPLAPTRHWLAIAWCEKLRSAPVEIHLFDSAKGEIVASKTKPFNFQPTSIGALKLISSFHFSLIWSQISAWHNVLGSSFLKPLCPLTAKTGWPWVMINFHIIFISAALLTRTTYMLAKGNGG